MRPPLKLKPVRGRQLDRLREMYDQAEWPRLRRRAQTVLLAQAGYETAEIAEITRQSCWTVRRCRWLHRFTAGGCEGLREGLRPGRPPEITPTIELFLRGALVKSPRDYGLTQPSWTTMLLSKMIKRSFKCEVSGENIRQHLHAVDGVCRRPTWTVRHRAEGQPGYAPKRRDFKAIAHRPKDLEDIRSIAENYPNLDAGRIEKWVKAFGEVLGTPDLWDLVKPLLNYNFRLEQ